MGQWSGRKGDSLGNALHGLELVYYVKHLGSVKIGTTTDLPMRLRTLRITKAEVLAYEFGGRALERERHMQFRHLRIREDGMGQEHFRPTRELLDHILEVRAAAFVSAAN